MWTATSASSAATASSAVTLESPDGTLPLEMVKKFTDAGFRFVEVPVHHYHRVYGRSQFFNVARLARVVGEIARMWWKLVVKQEFATNKPAAVAESGDPVGSTAAGGDRPGA